jgi:hypothetical protein
MDILSSYLYFKRIWNQSRSNVRKLPILRIGFMTCK